MSVQLLEDNELIQLYINGNEASLNVLLQRHKRKLFSSILVVVREKALAEDIFQDTFIKAIQTLKRGKYNEEGKFLPWLLRIARNLIIDHYRRIKKMPPAPVYKNEEGEEVDVFAGVAAEDEDFEERQQKHRLKYVVKELVNELPLDQREVVMMRMYYDMSFKEIADITNVSINTSLGRMRYALINLKKMLEERKVAVY
jgi:RNA polymerase sigma factor (sigma-70 family)